MEVILANPCGFCYGVKRAVRIAESAVEHLPAATLGPLIHNPQVTEELKEKGILCKDSLDEFSPGETVIFRSHGVGPSVYEEAVKKNLQILDATCPNVKMNQKKASQAVSEGYFVVIIGENAHPETKSVLAFCGNNGIILECKDDIGKLPQNGRYCVLSQTTYELAKFEEMLGFLQKSRPGEYRVEKSICLATSERQQAAAKLAKEVDAFVVLGGRNSANTRHLTELVSAICPRCYQVETAAELSPEMFRGCNKIGITAGASTPDRIIKEAVMAMENMENKKMEGDFAAMLDASMEDFGVHPGKLVNGKVSQVDKDGVYVDFGYTCDGLIAWKDWAVDADYEKLMDTVHEGDDVEAVVIPSSSEDFVGLSKIRAEKEAAWKNIAPLAEGEKRPAKVKVLRVIKKRNRDRDAENANVRPVVGLAVAVEGVEGFMPASHVELRHIDDFTPYVGQELDAEIIEVDPEKKRIVVSRRDLLKAEKARKHEEWLANREAAREAARAARAAKEEAAYEKIAEGEIYEGKVVKVAEFGLFVEVVDGLVGLVHNSELSYDRGVKAGDVAKEGDMVKVFVKKIDKENHRVSLSIKATMEDPWIAAAADFKEGQMVEGTVDRFLPFGALVRLNDKVEGMIHVSEIAEERVEKPEDVLKIGQVVNPMIIKIDRAHRKIGLSLTRAKKNAEKAQMDAYMSHNSDEALTNNAMAEQLEGLKG